MLLKDFVGDREVLTTPYQNGVMLIIRAAEPGQPDDRILLNSSKFSKEDRELIRSGKLEEFVGSRGNYNVAQSETGNFFYLVPPTKIVQIKPKWGDPNQGKPWWETMFDDSEPEVPF